MAGIEDEERLIINDADGDAHDMIGNNENANQPGIRREQHERKKNYCQRKCPSCCSDCTSNHILSLVAVIIVTCLLIIICGLEIKKMELTDEQCLMTAHYIKNAGLIYDPGRSYLCEIPVYAAMVAFGCAFVSIMTDWMCQCHERIRWNQIKIFLSALGLASTFLCLLVQVAGYLLWCDHMTYDADNEFSKPKLTCYEAVKYYANSSVLEMDIIYPVYDITISNMAISSLTIIVWAVVLVGYGSVYAPLYMAKLKEDREEELLQLQENQGQEDRPAAAEANA